MATFKITETALLGVHVPAAGTFPAGALVPVFIDGKRYGYPGREIIKFGRVIAHDVLGGSVNVKLTGDDGYVWITENLGAKNWREYLTSPRFASERETWNDVGVDILQQVPKCIREELTENGETTNV